LPVVLPDPSIKIFIELVLVAELEPAQGLRPNQYSCHFGFRRRLSSVRGLRISFTLAMSLLMLPV
jgi:hypothetical protein